MLEIILVFGEKIAGVILNHAGISGGHIVLLYVCVDTYRHRYLLILLDTVGCDFSVWFCKIIEIDIFTEMFFFLKLLSCVGILCKFQIRIWCRLYPVNTKYQQTISGL